MLRLPVKVVPPTTILFSQDDLFPQAIPLHPRVQILQAAQGLELLRGPHSSRNLHFQMRAVLPEPLLI